jgi:hypothetical protein
MAKYLLIAAILVSLGTVGIGVVNHGKLTDAVAETAATKSSLATSQKNLTAAQADLKTTKATLDATSADKEKIAADLTTANTDLSKAKSDLDAANKTIADDKTQLAAKDEEIAKLQGGSPSKDPNAPVVDVAALNQHIQELEASVESANTQLKTAQEKVAVLTKANEDRQKGLLKQGLEGRVLAVNPAWNFVVLSIGDKQGVTNNAELLLKRSGQYLGKVRITSVEPSTSIADIVANTLPSGVAVQPGDSVIFQGQQGQTQE